MMALLEEKILSDLLTYRWAHGMMALLKEVVFYALLTYFWACRMMALLEEVVLFRPPNLSPSRRKDGTFRGGGLLRPPN
jgi:hypothetical protein